MAWILLRAFLFGLIGLVVVPVAIFALVLGTGYAFDSRCGTPGDSGGCEMGAASVAMASAIPSFALFFLIAVVRAVGRRKRVQTDFAGVLDEGSKGRDNPD
jgi:hypothetical protein